jgi:hypothetical protein
MNTDVKIFKPEEKIKDDAYIETWDKPLLLSDLMAKYGSDAIIYGYAADEIRITFFKKNPNYDTDLALWKECRKAELKKELEELENET